MDPNKSPPRPRKAVSAAMGAEGQSFDVPPQDELQGYNPFIHTQAENIGHSGSSANTSSSQAIASSSQDDNSGLDPLNDPVMFQMRDEVRQSWPEGRPNRQINEDVFRGITQGTNRALNRTRYRDYDSIPFLQRFPGTEGFPDYIQIEYKDDNPRWVMSQHKLEKLNQYQQNLPQIPIGSKKRAQESRQRSREVMRAMKREKDKGRARQLLMRSKALLRRRLATRPMGSEGRGVMMPYRRGNLALAKKRAQESRQRSRNVMRAMKREKDKGRARQLLMRSKALLRQRLATRPNPEIMKRLRRKKAKKQSWKGMAHRMVYQRSPYKVHSQNLAKVKQHMQKRRKMARRGAPSIVFSELQSKRHIKPIKVKYKYGYNKKHVKRLPKTLHRIKEKIEPQDQGLQYFPTEFRGFPPRPIAKPFLVPASRLTSPTRDVRPPLTPSPSRQAAPHSPLHFHFDSPLSSPRYSSDEEMDIDDTDADTDAEN